MARTIFDHLKGVTSNKTEWASLSEDDKKSWDDYMVTRWLSMKPEYLEYLNEIQVYRNSGLNNQEYYKLLFYSLPNYSTYYKYIKRPRTYELKKELLSFFSNVYKVSFRESLDITTLFRNLKLNAEFDELLLKYGIQEEQKIKLRKELFDE